METVEKEVQTEQVPGKEDRMEEKQDGLKAEVAEALTSVFQYMEQLKLINLSQEQLILRLNTMLDQPRRGRRPEEETLKIGKGGVEIMRWGKDTGGLLEIGAGEEIEAGRRNKWGAKFENKVKCSK